MSFTYRNGILHAENVPLPELAARHGTPTYVYSTAALRARLAAYVEAFRGIDPLICYALKANSNQAVIATFAREGAGADVVSMGELKRALAAGVPARKIVFAGVGKTAEEMRFALQHGILQFNVESEPELRLLSDVACGMGVTAPVALRVNPDVDAKTHAKITTGKAENKFGIDMDHAPGVAALAKSLPGIALEALALHIGSQLMDVAPFRTAFARLGALARQVNAAGGPALRRLDFGGGVGVGYAGEAPPDLRDYAEAVRSAIAGLGVGAILEPGRSLVAEAGVLLGRVIRVKEGVAKRFAIVDTAMNDLIRPTLYEAWMPILAVSEPRPGANRALMDVVGPICETGDYLALDRELPPLNAGDLFVVGGAGAYGAAMSSSYNTRPLAAELLVNGDQVAVIRPRQDIDALIAGEKLAPWLTS
ncbi:MAG: diaminopimelate decarboxylase [Alphaproteobacteria bacterium]|nr:diaminopimelate decarboxylase [Alphaproteobacteria bacterium]